MATYILLINWTDQGIKSVKDSPKRLDAARELAKQAGCELRDFYMTIGHTIWWRYSRRRTTTLKAFDEDTYRKLLGAL